MSAPRDTSRPLWEHLPPNERHKIKEWMALNHKTKSKWNRKWWAEHGRADEQGGNEGGERTGPGGGEQSLTSKGGDVSGADDQGVMGLVGKEEGEKIADEKRKENADAEEAEEVGKAVQRGGKEDAKIFAPGRDTQVVEERSETFDGRKAAAGQDLQSIGPSWKKRKRGMKPQLT
ncbi:Hypothetical protein D9617_1g086830 [Elsinoe fawcettii]|nr:Hypothetical protein D9617_1g086830 [Elsinoe fawcettii]